jgi:hypothetical protein
VPWEATVGWFAHLALIAAVFARWMRRPDRSPRDVAGLAVAFAGTHAGFGLMLFLFGRPFLPRYLALFVP